MNHSPHGARVIRSGSITGTIMLVGGAAIAQVPDHPIQYADAGPRFLAAAAPGREDQPRVDARNAAVFTRRIALALVDAPLRAALDTIASRAGLHMVVSSSTVSLVASVNLTTAHITVGAALTAVLYDAGVDIELESDGTTITVVPRRSIRLTRVSQAQVSGAIHGRVTDALNSQPLRFANVTLDGARATTTTDRGEYRFVDVSPALHAVSVRVPGYSPLMRSIRVNSGEDVGVDLALTKSAQRLDEVVATGTVVPTKVKALPTPVSIISDSDIVLQRPHSVQEVLRQAVPTMVSWDQPGSPDQTAFSVRGASTMSGGTGQMKVFVDGIPVADMTLAAVDPGSIARIEVIRGPQAAAIYGSDAVGGVVQVFTKRGDSTLTRPQVATEAALGVAQTPYAGYGGVIRQSYAGSVQGGGPGVSYHFGAGYTRMPDWVQPATAQSNPSVYGGVHVTRDLLTADVSSRYFVENVPTAFNPDLTQTGFPFYAKPRYAPVHNQYETIGARINVAVTPWWQHTITAGIDRNTQDQTQTQPRLTSPADTFLTVSNTSEAKTSIGYNTAVRGVLGDGVTGLLTAGFDHYSLPVTSWFTAGALSTTGGIVTDPNQPVAASRTATSNTGYFAQGQLAIRDALFLTGGARAERNTNFGDSLGTPVSPQVGITYAPTVGWATVKLRGSWGRAIRPPAPELKLASVGGGFTQLANAHLGPERQQGWDTGVDAVFGASGSLSVTYYNQTAEDLIAQVIVGATPTITSQYQNVGRVKNSGVEVEGSASGGPVQLRAQYGYVRSRIQDLGPNYSGDLAVGDQPLFTPANTAGASLSVTPGSGTIVAAGLTYVGAWHGYDLIALFSCFAGTGPCQPGPGLRNYIVPLPGFVKVNASVSQELTRFMSGFVSVDNLGNNTAHEFFPGAAVIGRISTVGLQFHP